MKLMKLIIGIKNFVTVIETVSVKNAAISDMKILEAVKKDVVISGNVRVAKIRFWLNSVRLMIDRSMKIRNMSDNWTRTVRGEDMKEKKHPNAIAWEKWLESEEGLRCLKGTASGQYLQNRLWYAFMAGIKAASKRKRGGK